MSGPISSLINGYNIDTARSLLSAADYFPEEERGCLDSICTLINNIWITVKRVFHYIFSCDHQWYNNGTALAIITYYARNYEENLAARDQVRDLVEDLRHRALNGGCCGNSEASIADDFLDSMDGENLMEILYDNLYIPRPEENRNRGSEQREDTVEMEDLFRAQTNPDRIRQIIHGHTPPSNNEAPRTQTNPDALRQRSVDVIRPGETSNPFTSMLNRWEADEAIGGPFFEVLNQGQEPQHVPPATNVRPNRIPLVEPDHEPALTQTRPATSHLQPTAYRPQHNQPQAVQVRTPSSSPINSDEELRMKFQRGATGNITLLERTQQLLDGGAEWEEIEGFLTSLEDSLRTHTVRLPFYETLDEEGQRNAYKAFCSLWAPRKYDASNDANLPNIDSTPNESYKSASDPYDLFQTAIFYAAIDLGITPLELAKPAFINSAEMMKVCRLAILNLLEQAKLDTHSCAGHSVNFNSHLLARYQPPIVAYTKNAEDDMVEKIYYNTDILSSTEVGCDPVGAKRLLQNIEDNGCSVQFKQYLVNGQRSPEELDETAGNPANPSLNSPVLKELIDTMAEQVKNRYGKTILPLVAQEMLGQDPEEVPSLENCDFQSYTKGAKTPHQVIERAFKWSAQCFINEGVLKQDDVDGALAEESYGYAKQIIGKAAILNLIKHAAPVHDFRIKLTEHVEMECGRFYAYEPRPENPALLVASERYIPNDFCGNGSDDEPGTDLIKAKKLMSELSAEELNFAEDYLYAVQLQELYKLKGEQNINLAQTANAKLEELPTERKGKVRDFVNEVIKIHKQVTFSLFDNMFAKVFEEAIQETPPAGAIKFDDTIPLRARGVRSAVPEIPVVQTPVETPLVRQLVQIQYLDESLWGQIAIKDRPKRTAPPSKPIRNIRDHGSVSQAIIYQNQRIDQHPAVGSCMYGALAIELFKNVSTDPRTLDRYATYLRQAVADYMLDNPEQFLQAMSKPEDSRGHRTETEASFMRRMRGTLQARLEAHCRKVRDTLEWGTGLELEAIACIFGVPIHVIDEQNHVTIGTTGIEAGVIQPNSKFGDTFDGAPIRMVFANGVHYEPIRLYEARQ